MKRIITLVVLLAVGLPAASGEAGDAKTSDTVDAYTYMESNGHVTFLVDSQIAYFREAEAYIPLQIAVGTAKEKKGELIRISLNNFTLLDAAGNAYKPAPVADILDEKKYGKRDGDTNLVRSDPIRPHDTFNTAVQIGSGFYPSMTGPGLEMEAVELPAFTWFRDLIYFPRPKGGSEGVLTLLIETPHIDPPLKVRFEIPEKHHKDDGK